MTQEQREALISLCARYDVPFFESAWKPSFDLPTGYVAGWAGDVYAGCSPEGRIST